MSWFCSSSNKQRSRSNPQPPKDDNNCVTSQRSIFAVVLKNFSASVSDELSVTRGQMIEALYCDQDWVYVRNVDGVCGYIPLNFCYNMTKNLNGYTTNTNNVNQMQGSESMYVRPRPRPKSLHLAPQSTEGRSTSNDLTSTSLKANTNSTPSQAKACSPSQVHYNTLSQAHTSTPSQSHTPALSQATQSQPHSPYHSRHTSPTVPKLSHSPHRIETPDSTPPMVRSQRRLSSQLVLNVMAAASATPPGRSQLASGVKSYSATAVSSNLARGNPSVRRSLSMNDGNKVTYKPHLGKAKPFRRSLSYQEAVQSTESNVYALVVGCDNTDLNQSPQNSRQAVRVSSCQSGGDSNSATTDYDPSDDVFLPEPKKPLGIYRCIRTHKPKFENGVMVKDGELVILLEHGRGNWAWIQTCDNREGMVPRQILVRYNSKLGVGGPGHHGTESGTATRTRATSNTNEASTQTELVVSGPVRQVSGASSASVGMSAHSGSSSGSVTTPQATPPIHHRTTNKNNKKDSMKGVEKCSALAASQTDKSSSNWFDNLDSLERHPRPMKLECSTKKTTPPLSQRTLSSVIPATPQSVKSADYCMKPRTPNPAGLVTPRPSSKSSRGPLTSEFWFDTISSTSSSITYHNQNPVLRALRDYNPPSNSKNCLNLTSGDTLYAQPHMHYPRGWLWVWHSTQRSFGYVPQSYVGYTYDVEKTQRAQKNAQEEAV